MPNKPESKEIRATIRNIESPAEDGTILWFAEVRRNGEEFSEIECDTKQEAEEICKRINMPDVERVIETNEKLIKEVARLEGVLEEQLKGEVSDVENIIDEMIEEHHTDLTDEDFPVELYDWNIKTLEELKKRLKSKQGVGEQ